MADESKTLSLLGDPTCLECGNTLNLLSSDIDTGEYPRESKIETECDECSREQKFTIEEKNEFRKSTNRELTKTGAEEAEGEEEGIGIVQCQGETSDGIRCERYVDMREYEVPYCFHHKDQV